MKCFYWSPVVCWLVLATGTVTLASDGHHMDDYHFDHRHSYRYASAHPSALGSHSASSHQWFYKTSNNNKGMNVGSDALPPALTPIDRFLSTGRLSDSTGIRGHFPFAYHQNDRDSRKASPVVTHVMSIPDIPEIPPLPALPTLPALSPLFNQRPKQFDYFHQNGYNRFEYPNNKLLNDYSHGRKPITDHDNSPQHHNWHYSHHSDHSYRQSWDHSDPSPAERPHSGPQHTSWWRKLPFQVTHLTPNVQNRHKREKFSHRSSSAEDMFRPLPVLDNNAVKNNGFFKETHFSWSYEDNKPLEERFGFD